MKQWKKRGLRLLCLCLCAVCLMTTVMPVRAVEEETETTAPVAEYIRTCLVHSGPSAGYAVIGRMEDGTSVTVLEQKSSYYKIDCYDTVGYIAASQLVQRENGEYYIQCDPESPETGTIESRSVSDALLLRSAVFASAEKQLGDPYVYGAAGPRAFDCSGLTSYVYGQNGFTLQRACDGQMADGLIVSRNGLQVGDLIFFRTSGYQVGHVGIYVGNGQIIHAGNGGVGYAELSDAWFADRYLCARRIITVSAQTMEPAPVAAENCLSNTHSTGLRTAR